MRLLLNKVDSWPYYTITFFSLVTNPRARVSSPRKCSIWNKNSCHTTFWVIKRDFWRLYVDQLLQYLSGIREEWITVWIISCWKEGLLRALCYYLYICKSFLKFFWAFQTCLWFPTIWKTYWRQELQGLAIQHQWKAKYSQWVKKEWKKNLSQPPYRWYQQSYEVFYTYIILALSL